MFQIRCTTIPIWGESEKIMARVERKSNIGGLKEKLASQINEDYDWIELCLQGLMDNTSMELPEQAALFQKIRKGLSNGDGIVDISGIVAERGTLQAENDALRKQIAELEAARTQPPTMEDVANSPIQLGAGIGNDDKVDHESFLVDTTQKELLKLLGASANKGWLELLIKLLNDQHVNKAQRARALNSLKQLISGNPDYQLVAEDITQAHQDAVNDADTAKAKLKKAEGDIRDLTDQIHQAKIATDDAHRALNNERTASTANLRQAEAERDTARSARDEIQRKFDAERDASINGSLAQKWAAEKAQVTTNFNAYYDLVDELMQDLNKIGEALPRRASEAQRLIDKVQADLSKKQQQR